MKDSRFFSLLRLFVTFMMFSGIIILISCQNKTDEPEGEGKNKIPHIVASSQIEAGRYLAIVGGCNDCHTEGYLQSEGKVPEEDWFAGSFLGWRGPWGTTYPPNLRLSVQEMTEEEWVMILHEREDLPPMPWMNVNQMSEEDAKALYQYLKSLGSKGKHSSEALGPGVEPETPYLSLEPQNLPQ
jgi:mono/diheme cytochrome c family protein